MPAKSKAQQRLFGMVHAYQKGELDNPSKTIKKIGDNISFKKAKKFASTKHKKLPEKVDESSIKQYIPDAVYIVCDGTSCYGCFGCDIEDEIEHNDVEVVKGPFAQWNDRVDELIEKMNDKMYEGKMATTRLTESQLKKIITESVKRVLKEYTDPSTDGAIYPHREEDIKRDAYRLKGKFIGDKTHRQSASDDIKTSNKYRRYDAWSEEDGIKHGAPFYIPLLNAMNAAKKALNHEFAETIDRNPNIKPKEQKFLEDKWQQAMDGLEKSFYEIRNYYREQGRGTLSDYRGR